MLHVRQDEERRRSGRRGGRGGRGGVVTLLAVLGGVVVLLMVARSGILGFDLPDWFDGGADDKAPRGQVLYEGQKAEAASERFLIDIGDGEAVVAVKAKQDHDTSGWWLNGDFQSTNGTSSVADPDDRDVPARLRVSMDYCAEGTITSEPGQDEGDPATVTFDLGEIFVCGSTLEHTPDNDAAFKQDDTPTRFHGNFVSFVSGAAETSAAAAACPTDELERFSTAEYTGYVRTQLAEQLGIDESQVEVVPGEVGHSDDEAKAELSEALESYANKRDPDHPDREYEALDIQYLGTDGSAVDDSCWRTPGSQDLDHLSDIDAPRPDDR
jgi:hypothetical protein